MLEERDNKYYPQINVYNHPCDSTYVMLFDDSAAKSLQVLLAHIDIDVLKYMNLKEGVDIVHLVQFYEALIHRDE